MLESDERNYSKKSQNSPCVSSWSPQYDEPTVTTPYNPNNFEMQTPRASHLGIMEINGEREKEREGAEREAESTTIGKVFSPSDSYKLLIKVARSRG